MKRLMILIALLFLTGAIYGKGFNTYEPELVYTFKIGTEDGMLKFTSNDNELTPSSSRGPTSLTFDELGNLYIVDTRSFRIVKYDSDFKFISNIKLSSSSRVAKLEVDSLGDYLLYYNELVIKLNREGKQLFKATLYNTTYDHKVESMTNSLVIDNYIIVYLKDGQRKCFEIVSTGEQTILNEVEPEQVLNKTSVSRSNNSTVTVNGGNIYKNGELITRRFQNFHKAKRLDSGNSSRGSKEESQVTRFGFTLEQVGDLQYISKDRDNNTYWKLGRRRVLVLNNNGELIEALQYDMKASKTYFPAIHESGDIYFLNYDAKGVYLYRINRVW